MIIPIHLHVLLDSGRVKILDHMGLQNWDDLHQDGELESITNKILEGLALAGLQHSLSREAIEFLHSYNNVRRDGNHFAHSASENEIKEAVQTKPLCSQERCYLEHLL